MERVDAVHATVEVFRPERSRVRLWVPGWRENLLPAGFSMLGWSVTHIRSGITGEQETVLEWDGTIRRSPPACAIQDNAG